MGVSTDAILCYGIPIEENSDWDWLPGKDGTPDFEDRIAKLVGIKKPTLPYPEENHPEYERINQLYRDYWKQKQNAVETAAGVILVRHCSGDYPSSYWV